ncbi:PREDICTED: uncharacterized protein LOC109156541 [Ipomoea nil]|uniref:uncharacterized protein LOC109156541 n=1 Tax=Ipomoea nil TaxID=35883 RepID=UPI0009009A40|nr:PREDICTED: uncharacterized protein LOC109156541 [Ipomoea nil]
MVLEHLRSYVAAVMMNTVAGEGNSANPMNQSPIQRNEEFDDPLYLHFTENGNTVLVSPPLSEVNYASWSKSMKIALEIKNKFGFVVNSTIAESMIYFDKASNIWSALSKRYSQADLHKITELQNEIFRNVQGNMNLNECFTKCNALWEQMNAMRPLPTCECTPRCSCTLISKIQKEKQDDQIIRFLEGLNDEFESIKAGVLVMDPIPTMEKVLNMTLKIERKLKAVTNQKNVEIVQANSGQTNQNQSADEQGIIVFSALNNKKKFNNSGGRNIPKCTYCSMISHTVEKCYKKYDYPLGWVAGYKSRNKQGPDSASPSVNHVGDIGMTADQF